MEQLTKLIDMIVGNLSESARSDIVVGEPIEKDAITIVPLTKVSVGFGGGGGEGEGTEQRGKRNQHSGKGIGGGGGGGAKVSPVGVIIFNEDGVTVEPIVSRVGVFDKLFDRIPEMVDKANDSKKN